MGLTAKSEMQILYGINPMVSNMTGKVLQIKGMYVGSEEVHATPEVLG